jgi:phage-related protein
LRLVRIAPRRLWDVLAMADDAGRSVLTDLAAIDPSYRRFVERMRVTIEMSVPRNGPPIYDSRKCAALGDEIFELKVGPRTGKILRLLWFYDTGAPQERYRILCTHLFLKGTRQTPPKEKARAVAMRKQYLRWKRFCAILPIEERTK